MCRLWPMGHLHWCGCRGVDLAQETGAARPHWQWPLGRHGSTCGCWLHGVSQERGRSTPTTPPHWWPRGQLPCGASHLPPDARLRSLRRRPAPRSRLWGVFPPSCAFFLPLCPVPSSLRVPAPLPPQLASITDGPLFALCPPPHLSRPARLLLRFLFVVSLLHTCCVVPLRSLPRCRVPDTTFSFTNPPR